MKKIEVPIYTPEDLKRIAERKEKMRLVDRT